MHGVVRWSNLTDHEVSHWLTSERRRALSVPGVQFSLGGLLRTSERRTVEVGNREEPGAFQVGVQVARSLYPQISPQGRLGGAEETARGDFS